VFALETLETNDV